MVQTILIVVLIVAIWALVSRRLERWSFSAPLVMVFAGVLVGFLVSNQVGLAAFINTDVTRQVCEIILAVLLFVDSIQVSGERHRQTRGPALRLLLIALPLSLVLVVLVGLLLPIALPLPALIAVACIVMPTDFSPTTSMVKDPRIPARIRNILNVESGYNDGIVAPFFIFALTLAGDLSHASTPEAALGQAIPAILIAIGVGAGIGLAYAAALNFTGKKGWLSGQSARIGLAVLPILTYAVAVTLHGNGFVAAFVCGIIYARLRQKEQIDRDMSFVEDLNIFGTLGLWFVFGSVFILLFSDNLEPAYLPVLVLALLALTLFRIIPVLFSLWGTDLKFRERVLIGTLGPRGTASIVFGLLAFNSLPDDLSYTALLVTVTVVFFSILVHGFGSRGVISLFQAAERRASSIRST